ncbi:MAG: hypothetical protein QME78_06165 [Thermodesulfobacteriota bacterium]|nr:hypothetical protein [Thermodesulfobacteriota bacterium]
MHLSVILAKAVRLRRTVFTGVTTFYQIIKEKKFVKGWKVE